MSKVKKQRHKAEKAQSLNDQIASLWAKFGDIDEQRSEMTDDEVTEAVRAEMALDELIAEGFREGRMTEARIEAVLSRPRMRRPYDLACRIRELAGESYLPGPDGSLMIREAFVVPITGDIGACGRKTSEIANAVIGAMARSGYSADGSICIVPTLYAAHRIADIPHQSVFNASATTGTTSGLLLSSDLPAGDISLLPGEIGMRFLIGFRNRPGRHAAIPDGFSGPMGMTQEEREAFCASGVSEEEQDRLMAAAEARYQGIIDRYDEEMAEFMGDAATVLEPIPWDKATTGLLKLHLQGKEYLGGVKRDDPKSRILVTGTSRAMRIRIYARHRNIADVMIPRRWATLCRVEDMEDVLDAYQVILEEPTVVERA